MNRNSIYRYILYYFKNAKGGIGYINISLNIEDN